MNKKTKLFVSVFALFAICLLAPMTVKAAITPPTNLHQTKSTDSYIYFEWTSLANASKYGIMYKDPTGNWSSERTVSSATANYSGLTGGTTYYVKVRAYEKTGSTHTPGDWSSEIAMYTLPTKVNTVKQTAAGNNSVTVDFTPSTGATGYDIYYNTTNAPATAFKFTTVGADAASCTVNGLQTGVQYYIFVQPVTNRNTGFTASGAFTGTDCYTCPNKPINLRITQRNVGSSSTSFSWDMPNGSYYMSAGYEFEAINAAGKKLDSARVGRFNHSYSLKKASAFTAAYSYRVRAYQTISDGKTIYGDWTAYNRLVPDAPIVKISGLYRGSTATIKWKKVKGAQSYTIYRATKSVNNKFKVVAKNVKGTSKTVKKLPRERNYYYVVANKVKLKKGKKGTASSINPNKLPYSTSVKYIL